MQHCRLELYYEYFEQDWGIIRGTICLGVTYSSDGNQERLSGPVRIHKQPLRWT